MKSPKLILTIILIGFGIFMVPKSYGQRVDSAAFAIKVLGITIGEMEVAKTGSSDQNSVYDLHSQVNFWFFGKIFLDHRIKCMFRDGQYIFSTVDSKTNKGDFLSKIEWKENHYQINANTYKYENQKPIDFPIYSSISELYFQKPKVGDVIISETYGLTSPIVEIEPDVFEITINGHKNHFYYLDGVLDKVMIENPIKNFIMQRIY
ncbi:DUF6134 family protein [Algoriphagus zhangzhouensis]|uniref:Uncharacterized protein n=1 Tax=Algoriphagus zhangzhouensis TaxID=1073327 RepID=A0A1M7Z5S9_9BACT|nr:DUF6134 family protein [Algoriphagus zhangzhouensis]TDY48907.1 hypothetical protein A8938_0598 [Algoriphagus zhangzhouensis]SHO60140.1 hypothetical protein SAMN04488108_0598 [Algoriphagus zhangzhouensis]